MTLQDAINGYTTSTRPLLLTNGNLDQDRIALVYNLDQAVDCARILVDHFARGGNPFSVDVTLENLDIVMDEAENMDERFSDSWVDKVNKIRLLMNYCY